MVENKPAETADKAESKKAAKKEAKKAEKAAKKAEHKGANPQQQLPTEEGDVSTGKYGVLPLIRSETNSVQRAFTYVKELNKSLADKQIWVRARLHAVRARGKQCFIVLRQREFTIQVLVNVSETVSKGMVKFASKYVIRILY